METCEVMNSNDSNNQYETSSCSDSESEIDDNDYIPEIEDVELTKKETFYYKIINKFYKNLDKIKVVEMIDIIECKSKISLRLLDWFVTRYANKYKIRFEKNENDELITKDDRFDKKIDNGFNVHISYKAQLKSYKKRYFDPFRRRKKFKYYFDREKTISLCTTIGQLNFFKWAFTNNVVEYVISNHNLINKAMVNTNKIDKSRKLKEKEQKHDNSTKNESLTIKKHGININAKKQINNDNLKIILSFD